MDEVFAIAARQAPAGALVGIVVVAVLALLRGYLVPHSTVDKLIEVQELRLKESRDREIEWRRAWEVSEAARGVLAGNDADLLEAMRTLEALIRALPPAPRGDRT